MKTIKTIQSIVMLLAMGASAAALHKVDFDTVAETLNDVKATDGKIRFGGNALDQPSMNTNEWAGRVGSGPGTVNIVDDGTGTNNVFHVDGKFDAALGGALVVAPEKFGGTAGVARISFDLTFYDNKSNGADGMLKIYEASGYNLSGDTNERIVLNLVNSISNGVQIIGVNGSAAATLIASNAFNGSDAGTTLDLNFDYDGSSAIIASWESPFKSGFQFDNVLFSQYAAPSQNQHTNFLVIVADDHRWDATGYMQDALATDPNRTPRFPYLSGTTPALDTLASEGVLFENAFSTYSLCSPSRATMLTGLHAHKHGVTDNKNPFPANLDTYASLLQQNGYVTGYFGKWHMGEQVERPGFTEVATYVNQGAYYGSVFKDENGADYPADSTTWVDDRTTGFALDFIDAQVDAGQPFLAFVGFKTPHIPRTPPDRHSTTYDGNTPADVPNLQQTHGIVPPWDPGASGGASNSDTLNYMKTVAGIDDNIADLLAKLDARGITSNTVVVYISDQGYFRNEHGLGDKRAAYEESIRVPFIIRHPALQSSQANVQKIALNLDLAPTILDLAGIDIPPAMQGKSLKPFIQDATQVPADWRTSFLFTYNYDQEYPGPTSVPEYVAIRNENGDKLIAYSEDSTWDELFTGDDPYEIDNKINNPAFASLLAELRNELRSQIQEYGFMNVHGIRREYGFLAMDIDLGESYRFVLDSSSNLQTWTSAATIEGSDRTISIELFNAPPASWSHTIVGEIADYGLTQGNTSTGQGELAMKVGMEGTNARNAVLVFGLPAPPEPGDVPSHAQLQVHANKRYAKFDCDLYAIGYTDTAAAKILEYHATPAPSPDVVKLQDTFLDETVPSVNDAGAYLPYTSNLASGLSAHLRKFYAENPDYTGGKFIHLRINPNIYNPAGTAFYRIRMANDPAQAPELKLAWEDPPEEDRGYYRVRMDYR